MAFMKTFASLALLALTHVSAQDPVQCPANQKPFLLGAHSPTILREDKGAFVRNEWRKRVGDSKKRTKVRPIKDIDHLAKKGGRIGWKVVEGTDPHEVIGIGMAHNHIYQYDDPGDGMIEGDEAILVRFQQVLKSVTVGAHLLHQGETLRWIAYLNGKKINQGTASGVNPESADAAGKVSVDINLNEPFNQLAVGSVDNAEYLLEYMEGCYYDGSEPNVGPVCTGPTGKWSGDPHITTFDGLKYDCQGRGEFTMVDHTDWIVQGRFILGGNDRNDVTVTKAVVVQVPVGPKIQINVPEGNDLNQCDYTFYIDDIARDVEDLGTNSDAVTAVVDDDTVLFHYPQLGARFEVRRKLSRVNGCVLAVQFCLPSGTTNAVGLLGTPNNKRSDDWKLPNSTQVVIPTTKKYLRFQPAFEYCVNWCIGEESSIFKYTGGTDYSTYNFDCQGEYDDTLEKEMDVIDQNTELIEVCTLTLQEMLGNHDRRRLDEDEDTIFACLIDGTIGGVEDAVDTIECETELVEVKVTPPAQSVAQRVAIISGDPHIKTWGGETYDFHGECDLLLLHNPKFNEGLGMDIQVRSKHYRQWAYISSAVVRIGEDTLEVRGQKDIDGSTFWVNGAAHGISYYMTMAGKERQVILPYTISGYPISLTMVNKNQHEFNVDLGQNQWIVFKTWKNFVRVDLVDAKASDFGDSVGLMGTFLKGTKVARDRTTIIDDPNEFGMEWQVLADEPIIFHNMEGPQAPAKCILPNAADIHRRLGESIISQDEAKKACSRVNENDRDFCIFDVMATNDLHIAGAY